MVKSELVAKLAAENPTLSKSDVERVVNAMFDTMMEQLASGGRVELRGFGAFSVRQRDARVGRNPRSGEPVPVKAKGVPFFRLGRGLKRRLNADDA